MTRKHYAAIAGIIKIWKDVSVFRLVWELSKYFQKENTRFNHEKFFLACGFKHGKSGPYKDKDKYNYVHKKISLDNVLCKESILGLLTDRERGVVTCPKCKDIMEVNHNAK